jgi:hypothetical protein
VRQFTNARGEVIDLPEIDYAIARRLKRWGVVDLLAVVNDPKAWSELFERLASDMEFIVDVAYSLVHETPGTESQQIEFATSLFGHGQGGGPLILLSESLREAVIDFFPADRRGVIRQLWSMTVMTNSLEMFRSLCPDLDSTGLDLQTVGSGASTCSESSGTMEADLA